MLVDAHPGDIHPQYRRDGVERGIVDEFPPAGCGDVGVVLDVYDIVVVGGVVGGYEGLGCCCCSFG